MTPKSDQEHQENWTYQGDHGCCCERCLEFGIAEIDAERDDASLPRLDATAPVAREIRDEHRRGFAGPPSTRDVGGIDHPDANDADHAAALIEQHVRTAAYECDWNNLTSAQIEALLAHSEDECEQCGKRGLVYLHDTEGFDPTTWHLCAAHHPGPDGYNLAVDYEYGEFLDEPLADTYEEHLRISHEPHVCCECGGNEMTCRDEPIANPGNARSDNLPTGRDYRPEDA